jgi:hypothetical protein
MQFTFFGYRDTILYRFESSHLSQSFVLNQIGIQQRLSVDEINEKCQDENGYNAFLDDNDLTNISRPSLQGKVLNLIHRLNLKAFHQENLLQRNCK